MRQGHSDFPVAVDEFDHWCGRVIAVLEHHGDLNRCLKISYSE
jgi:hypothetical protein